jgi:hypothetical protein
VDEFIAYLNIMEVWILELEPELMTRSSGGGGGCRLNHDTSYFQHSCSRSSNCTRRDFSSVVVFVQLRKFLSSCSGPRDLPSVEASFWTVLL